MYRVREAARRGAVHEGEELGGAGEREGLGERQEETKHNTRTDLD